MTIATLNWLRQQCSENLLTEKWLLCDSLRTGQVWKDRVNLVGTTTVNLHPNALRSIAVTLASQYMVQNQLVYINHNGCQSLVHDLINQELEAGSLNYFASVQHTDGLAQLAARTIRDMRLAEVTTNDLNSSRFEVATKAADLKLLYQRYNQALQERSLIDYAACLSLATSGLQKGKLTLPAPLLILQPANLDWTFLEEKFAGQLRRHTEFQLCPQAINCSDDPKLQPSNTNYYSGYGEANEIRAVLQRVVTRNANACPWDDVEIGYTDDSYVPLIYELFQQYAPISQDTEPSNSTNLPVSFSQGIAAIYSRPGRALRAWLRWIQSDYLQTKAVQLIREGVLNRPKGENPIGYSRLAANLRRINIGCDPDRYLPAIQSAIDHAIESQNEFLKRREIERSEEDRETEHDYETPRDFGLPALQMIKAMVQPLIEWAPTSEDSAKSVLEKAKTFLLRCARCENKLDRFARTKLLDEIDVRLASLDFADESAQAIIAWLVDLPVGSNILGTGPQPGCVYVTPIAMAGVSGRKHLFVVGMDAKRFPRINRVDPLLLDSERIAISSSLPTSTKLSERNSQQLIELLRRATDIEDVQLAFSYSSRNLVDDRDQTPSPTLVQLYRQSHDLPEANLGDLLNHIGVPTSFASTESQHWLRSTDGQLTELLTAEDFESGRALIENQFPHLAAAHEAQRQQASSDFTPFDGWVPEAGTELSPTNALHRVSPSRLETFGACPRRFLFRYGLAAYPPDEFNMDPECWLDPMSLGNLLHSLLETFLRQLTSEDATPSAQRDLPRLLQILDDLLDSYRQNFPIPNQDAFERQKDWLKESCEIFLDKEETYCRETGAKPWVLEAAIGLDEEPNSPLDCHQPVSLALKNGTLLRVGGRIDRVDRIQSGGSESYAIWDYKSGSNWGFSQDDAFKQGRKLQSFLYVGMLRHRLAAIGADKNAAITFGYFFPNAKTQGQRIQWTAGELKEGDTILQNICQMIQQGVFPATTEPDDCKYCDYQSVCVDVQLATSDSARKAVQPQNESTLSLWKQMRQL